MNTEKAINILNLSLPFSLNELKRNYHKQSLKLHPDKNNSPNATAEFQELKNAYEYLKLNIDDFSEIDTNEFDFFEILNNFTSKLSGKKLDKSLVLNIIENLSEKFSENSKLIYKELFEGIDKQTSLDLFEYLKKYAEVFNISNDTLNKIGDIINEKFENDEIIKLHPTIDNLISDDVYKLDFDNTLYYIPLWHHEIIYDLSFNNQLIINIIPNLEHHISIDDYNNVHIHLTKNIKGLLTSKTIMFNIGKKVFNIPCNELYIKKKQK